MPITFGQCVRWQAWHGTDLRQAWHDLPLLTWRVAALSDGVPGFGVYRGGNTALTHRRLVYDAFGRLVRVAAVEGMDETDVALYRYNGLNMRLMWQDDADADSTLESSERFYIMHDERWRPVATFRDTDTTPKEAFVWHAAGLFGGADLPPET